MKRKEGRVPSAEMPFVNVLTDGGHKDKHNREVMFVLTALKKAGVKRYNLMHVNDAGLDGSIPMAYQNHFYDIGYMSTEGSLFLIEVMRIL
jgi:hypothetical protein